MASKKVGTLIRQARTAADLTQEGLARKIKGLSASDISLVERGQKDLTQAQLKLIAKATGVTQASLLSAAKEDDKPASAKKTAVKKSAATAKKTTAAKKTASSSGSSMKVTAAEKKLVELYREADADTKKKVLQLLKGEEDSADNLLEGILETVQTLLENK